jgi:hypothetical protein
MLGKSRKGASHSILTRFTFLCQWLLTFCARTTRKKQNILSGVPYIPNFSKFHCKIKENFHFISFYAYVDPQAGSAQIQCASSLGQLHFVG